MHYKTMVLNLIRSRPTLYRRLKSTRRLAAFMNAHSEGLRTSHVAWKDRLTLERPGACPQSLASAALELALDELTRRLDAEGSPSASEAANR